MPTFRRPGRRHAPSVCRLLPVVLAALLSGACTRFSGGESASHCVTSGGQSVCYEIEDGKLPVVEGDILIGESVGGLQAPRAARDGFGLDTSLWGLRWPNRTVYYSIDPDVPHQERIAEAIDHWEEKTQIRFVWRTTEPSYVEFARPTSPDLCLSHFGMIGGAQSLYIGDHCTRGNMIHELGHALGLDHEQNRLDRDRFVSIAWANVQAGQEAQFRRKLGFGDYGAYDCGSIMHYGPLSFSANGRPTIVPLHCAADSFMGQRNSLTPGDIATVAALYPDRFQCASLASSAVSSKTAFAAGSGSLADPFVICSAEQLALAASSDSYLSKAFVLGADLDLGAYDGSSPAKTFPGVGSYDHVADGGKPFTGFFDGNGHTVSGLVLVANASGGSSALFAYTRNAVIQNFTLAGVGGTVGSVSGSLVGMADDTTVSHCTSTGTLSWGLPVISRGWVGGLVGGVRGKSAGRRSMLRYSSANVTIDGGNTVGGLAGFVGGSNGGRTEVSHCAAHGNLSASAAVARAGDTFGGLIGFLDADTSGKVFLSDSWATGSVSTQGTFLGGLVSTIWSLNGGEVTIARSQARGNVASGGAGGGTNNHGSYLGGFVGISTVSDGATVSIDESWAKGDVTNSSPSGGVGLGGFAGTLSLQNGGNQQIANGFAMGTILAPAGSPSAGGFVGSTLIDAKSFAGITNSYAAPSTWGNMSGGFVGDGPGLVMKGCYYDSLDRAATVVQSPGILMGLSTAELRQAATFADWDFTTIWTMVEGRSFPTLRRGWNAL